MSLTPLCFVRTDIPAYVTLPVATALHDTVNNMSRELPHQLRKQTYDFRRADAIIKRLGVHNSRANESKKGPANTSKPRAAANGQQEQPAKGTLQTAQPATKAQAASANGAAQPVANGSQREQASPLQEAHDSKQEAAVGHMQNASGLKQEANGLKEHAENALHPPTSSAANPEPVARLQKRAASAQPATSGTATVDQSDVPAVKKARLDPAFSSDAAPATGAALAMLSYHLHLVCVMHLWTVWQEDYLGSDCMS